MINSAVVICEIYPVASIFTLAVYLSAVAPGAVIFQLFTGEVVISVAACAEALVTRQSHV